MVPVYLRVSVPAGPGGGFPGKYFQCLDFLRAPGIFRGQDKTVTEGKDVMSVRRVQDFDVQDNILVGMP